MVRQTLVTVLALATLVSTAQSVGIILLDDGVDDVKVVDGVANQEAVKAFRKELDEFEQKVLKKKEQEIEKLLGRPAAKAAKTYALPVAQPRWLALSGRRYADEKRNKDHKAFYPVGDFAAVEVWYRIDGESPAVVLVYFKADKTFPKLTKNNVRERLAWDRVRFAKLVKAIEGRQAGE